MLAVDQTNGQADVDNGSVDLNELILTMYLLVRQVYVDIASVGLD